MACTSSQAAPSLALIAAGLGSQLGLSWAPPGPAQVAALWRQLCSWCQVALGRAQVVTELHLHFIGGPRAITPSGQLQTILKHHPTISTSTHSRRDQSLSEVSPALWRGPPNSWSEDQLWSQPVLIANQPGSNFLPLRYQNQCLNHNRRVYTAHCGRAHLEHPALVIGKLVPLDPMGSEDVAALPIHRTKHRELAKMRKQRNMSQMKWQNKTSGKN